MHTLKKLYCRCFQTSFRAALPLMPYREPKLIDGFSGVPKVLRKHHITRLLLVTDPGVYSLGLTAPLEQLLKEAGIVCNVYKDTIANPTSANVEEAKDLYLKKTARHFLPSAGALLWTVPKVSAPDWRVRIKHWPRWRGSFMSCTNCLC